MKKTLSIVLCLIIMASFLLTGCGGTDLSGSEYLGTWKATTCEYGGMQIDYSQVGTFEFTLEEDGSVKLTTNDGTYDGTWSESDEAIYFDGDDSMSFVKKDSQLFLDYDGTIIYFSR